MKKCIFCFLLLFSVISIIYSEDDPYTDLIPEEYSDDEFSEGWKKIRRAEVIFIGSYPFSLLFTKIGYDFADYAGSGFSRSKAPAIFGGSEQEGYTDNETKQILVTALYVSAAFALTDYIIGEIKHRKAEKKERLEKLNPD